MSRIRLHVRSKSALPQMEQVELLELINEEVAKNLRVFTSTDLADLQQRMQFLSGFVKAVGANPPDELAGLCREVNQAYDRARPQFEQPLGAVLKLDMWQNQPRSNQSFNFHCESKNSRDFKFWTYPSNLFFLFGS